MSLAPGSSLGPYEIRSQLGQGGMGVVYLAQDPRLKRQVAIKLLPPDLTRDEMAKQRFLQGAQAASALDHPNIRTIFEINETADDVSTETVLRGGRRRPERTNGHDLLGRDESLTVDLTTRADTRTGGCKPRELARMPFSNLQDLKDEDGNWLPMSQWPREAAAAVARVKVRKENLTACDGVQEVVVDVQMWNKNQAIDSALKHLGMLIEPVEHGGDITIRWQTEEEAKGS